MEPRMTAWRCWPPARRGIPVGGACRVWCRRRFGLCRVARPTPWRRSRTSDGPSWSRDVRPTSRHKSELRAGDLENSARPQPAGRPDESGPNLKKSSSKITPSGSTASSSRPAAGGPDRRCGGRRETRNHDRRRLARPVWDTGSGVGGDRRRRPNMSEISAPGAACLVCCRPSRKGTDCRGGARPAASSAAIEGRSGTRRWMFEITLRRRSEVARCCSIPRAKVDGALCRSQYRAARYAGKRA